MEQEKEKGTGQPSGQDNSGNMAPKPSAVIRYVIPSVAAACLILMVVASWYLIQSWIFINLPPETDGKLVVFKISKGDSLWKISKQLKVNGLVRDSKKFRQLAEAQNKQHKARAGEFNLYTNMTAPEVLDVITTTSGILHKFSVREGLSWWATAEKAEKSGLSTYKDFKKAVHDNKLLTEFSIPAQNAEGYLFPETYMLTKPEHNSGKVLVKTMLKEFKKTALKAWDNNLPSAEQIHQTIILASLVEKETGDPTERATIAGVFANRLRKGYLLQSDPTTIYGLGETFDGNLTRKNLKDKLNPYNTYAHRGLPPGPICSPGLESIKAAIHPEKHNYLYFVAKGDGSHYFSKSLKEHNQAVKKYQLRRNKKTYKSYKAK